MQRSFIKMSQPLLRHAVSSSSMTTSMKQFGNVTSSLATMSSSQFAIKFNTTSATSASLYNTNSNSNSLASTIPPTNRLIRRNISCLSDIGLSLYTAMSDDGG
ncbi:hypothetical protein SAMD00019534_055320, partial [Acytostelium subglobosum LB1]|uniref:hypothetical protein n=1 Tax=Acytostelium subglobosum LB1 TaxID=1410327 RepID=UPI000644DC86